MCAVSRVYYRIGLSFPALHQNVFGASDRTPGSSQFCVRTFIGKMHAHCNSPPPPLPIVFISHNYCSVLEGGKMKVLEKKSGLLGFIPVNV